MRDPLNGEPSTRGSQTQQDGPAPGRPATAATGSGVRLRAMREEDLTYVVGQHLHHFPDGFFARLGPRFLHEYYRGFLTGSSARTIIAEVDGRTAGYLVGVTDPPAHRDHVVRTHGRALVVRAVLAMLVRPALAMLFLRTRAGLYTRKLLRRRRPVATPTPLATKGRRTAVLTHVAVLPDVQSHGLGSRMIGWFEAEVAAAGNDRLTLVTASGEDGAGPYYRRRGWHAIGERCTPDGMWLTTYERPVEAGSDIPGTPRREDTA